MKKYFLPLLFIFISFNASAKKAPDFTLKGLDSDVKLSHYRGKVVYLDFWASWCVPCRKTFPFMNTMHENYAEDGLKIIAINLDEEPGKAANFLKRFPANFTIAFDPEGKVSKAFKLSVVPGLYIINRDGYIVYKHKGFRNSETDMLESKIKQVLQTNNIPGP